MKRIMDMGVIEESRFKHRLHSAVHLLVPLEKTASHQRIGRKSLCAISSEHAPVKRYRLNILSFLPSEVVRDGREPGGIAHPELVNIDDERPFVIQGVRKNAERVTVGFVL